MHSCTSKGVRVPAIHTVPTAELSMHSKSSRACYAPLATAISPCVLSQPSSACFTIFSSLFIGNTVRREASSTFVHCSCRRSGHLARRRRTGSSTRRQKFGSAVHPQHSGLAYHRGGRSSKREQSPVVPAVLVNPLNLLLLLGLNHPLTGLYLPTSRSPCSNAHERTVLPRS